MHKIGFTYIYSYELEQEIAYSQKTGKAICQDGTVYTPEELEVINKNIGTLPKGLHILKKHFKGTVINDKKGES